MWAASRQRHFVHWCVTQGGLPTETHQVSGLDTVEASVLLPQSPAWVFPVRWFSERSTTTWGPDTMKFVLSRLMRRCHRAGPF